MTEQEMKDEIQRLKLEIEKLREDKKVQKQPSCPVSISQEYKDFERVAQNLGQIVRECCFKRDMRENLRFQNQKRTAARLSEEEYKTYESIIKEMLGVILKNYCPNSSHAKDHEWIKQEAKHGDPD